MMHFDFNNPTHLIFGSGSISQLGEQELPGRKALLLMSGGKSAKVSGAYDQVTAQLKEAGVEWAEFAKIMENPLKSAVMEGADFAKENGCDFILALGGGAVLDASAAVSAMATNPGDLWDYVQGGTGKGLPLQNPGLPIVTVTLTAGTGSEINFWGVISSRKRKSVSAATPPSSPYWPSWTRSSCAPCRPSTPPIRASTPCSTTPR